MLEDVLEPKEVIIFHEPFELEFAGDSYDELALTNRRVIFYKRTGLIFKKDNNSSIPLSNVNNVKFLEKGVIRKKGVLEIDIGKNKPIELAGNTSKIKYIYQKLLSNI